MVLNGRHQVARSPRVIVDQIGFTASDADSLLRSTRWIPVFKFPAGCGGRIPCPILWGFLHIRIYLLILPRIAG